MSFTPCHFLAVMCLQTSVHFFAYELQRTLHTDHCLEINPACKKDLKSVLHIMAFDYMINKYE